MDRPSVSFTNRKHDSVASGVSIGVRDSLAGSCAAVSEVPFITKRRIAVLGYPLELNSGSNSVDECLPKSRWGLPPTGNTTAPASFWRLRLTGNSYGRPHCALGSPTGATSTPTAAHAAQRDDRLVTICHRNLLGCLPFRVRVQIFSAQAGGFGLSPGRSTTGAAWPGAAPGGTPGRAWSAPLGLTPFSSTAPTGKRNLDNFSTSAPATAHAVQRDRWFVFIRHGRPP